MTEPATPTPTAQEVAGERRLRQLVGAFDLLVSLGIAGAALYIWFAWPKGGDIYSELQRGASELYLLVWMGIALAGALATLRRKTRIVSYMLTFLVLLECLAQLYYIKVNHRPYHPYARVILDRFEPNPRLGAIPRPSAFGGISHDAMHRRTTINEGKAANAKPVYIFGGSSAYDVGVADADTWASDLSRLLGADYEVQNYGVLSYTSLEAMIQSLFVFRDIQPVCAVYYEGWNDLGLAHVDNLPDDYGSMHATGELHALGVYYRPGNLANNWLALQLVDRAIQQGPGYPPAKGSVSDDRDLRLSRIYAENMRLIADIDRHFAVRPIFVPQIVNYEFIEAHYGWWWPMSAKAVRPRLAELNAVLKQSAQETGALFIDAPLNVTWQAGDFVDEGHFSAAGARKFAEAIAPGVAAACK